jgi:exosortase/archaeosortase family protein
MATPYVGYVEKAKVLIVGEPMFFLLNVFRLYVTVLCGYYYGADLMNVFHRIIWEVFTPAIVLIAWFFWLYLQMKPRAKIS